MLTQSTRITAIDTVYAVVLGTLDDVVARLTPHLRRLAATRAYAVLRGNLQLAAILGLRLVQRPLDRRAYRAENRRRGVGSHRYRLGYTPIAHTWMSIRLCIGAEHMGSRHFAGGYTLADGRA